GLGCQGHHRGGRRSDANLDAALAAGRAAELGVATLGGGSDASGAEKRLVAGRPATDAPRECGVGAAVGGLGVCDAGAGGLSGGGGGTGASGDQVVSGAAVDAAGCGDGSAAGPVAAIDHGFAGG